MRIALIHDQLQEFGGAERVLIALQKIFPEADIYTSLYNPEQLGKHNRHFENWNIKTSWANKVPFFKKFYSPLRFLTPLIWESLDLSGYDVVISSSGWYMSKGIITRPETLHICYLHHPPKYLYYYETTSDWQKYWPVRIYGHIVNHFLRQWDYLSSQRPDYFLANSQETAKRIEKFYRRKADVLYCPVEITNQKDYEEALQNKRDYYITVSRLVKAKHVDLIIETANQNKLKLIVVGNGKEHERLLNMAGKTVSILSHVTDAKLKELYAGAKAFLFASVDEEFGIAPVEAMGYGLPVIAYASGGLKETVQHGKNGFLYNDLSIGSLSEQIANLEKLSQDDYLNMSLQARSSSEQFTFDRFKEKILNFIASHISSKNQPPGRQTQQT